MKTSEPLHFVERVYAGLCGGVGVNASCLVTCCNEEKEGENRWITLNFERGSVGVAVCDDRCRLSRYQRLVLLARAAAMFGGRYGLKSIGAKEMQPATVERRYSGILQTAGRRERVRFAFSSDFEPSDNSPAVEFTPFLREIRGELKLSVLLPTIPAPLLVGTASPLRNAVWTLTDEDGIVIRVEVLPGDSRRIRMMEQKIINDELPVRVEMGTITLSAEALLGLRPGDEILLPDAKTLSGTLRVGPDIWARIVVETGEQGTVLKITELIAGEETSSAECRLRS